MFSNLSLMKGVMGRSGGLVFIALKWVSAQGGKYEDLRELSL